MGNQFIQDGGKRPGKVTTEMLYEYVEQINQRNFVRASGKPYFVGRKANVDGTFTHFLDRHA